MSSARNPKFYRSLSFRLTLWYIGILVLALALCLSLFYVVMVSAMHQRSDAYLTTVAQRTHEAMNRDGLDAATREVNQEISLSGKNDFFFRIFQTDKLVRSSDLTSWSDVNIPRQAPSAPEESNPAFESWSAGGVHANVRVLTMGLGSGTVLQLGMNVSDNIQLMKDTREKAGIIMMGMVLIAVLVGWMMARRALVGVQGLTATARDIADGRWDSRVAVTGRQDDIDQLSVTFNDMLDRLAVVVRSMKETNDNIAHELRSPLTRMRGAAETTMIRPELDAQARESAAITVEECDRLLGIINSMLDIAEAEARAVSWTMEVVDLAAVLEDACELFEPVAQDKAMTLSHTAQGDCRINGNMQQIQRVIANLIDNAVKYSPAGSRIDTQVARRDAMVELSVRNPGPGIPEKDLHRVFDRFYRCDSSRTTPGSGLGLSLAQAIVRTHGGTLSAASRGGEYTVFTLCIPATEYASKPQA